MPSYLYACANVDLFQGAPNPSTTSIATSTLPTNPLSTISTLTGPITFSETTSSANNATPTVFGTAPTATLSSNSSSSSRVARSTLTVTEVVTATACPPDITDCPARSTFLSTITTTSVSTAGGGAANSSATNPTSIPTSTSTETQQSTLTIISTYWTDEVITITYAESTVPYYTTYPILTTLYSCPGGCTGGPIYGAAATSTIPATSVQTATVSVAADTNVCGLKKRTRILRRDEV
ncbi:hypothetical protein MMC08_007744 [Hypocenomyce scalaris]|nr:hypothetical protein [Hypocenomyce scalaris]